MTKKDTSSKKPAALAEAVKQIRRERWNPLRFLSPQFLTMHIDAFESGDLAGFARLAETIAERDDMIKAVKPKREKAVAARKWKILKTDGSDEAAAHYEILKDFWNNARAVNAYDRNERGGMGRLVKQMMSAASFRYAVHHIVWEVKGGKLRASFEFVPLSFFENREGRLRFLRDGIGKDGEELASSDWMVTPGDGLMIACAIQYLGKRFCTQDLLAFSEKFSMPGILGRTSAAKGSDAGQAMKTAVENFGQDFAAVVYGDDGSAKIELIQPDGNPQAMPMPAFIERADRRIAGLYMGADLSTMSSTDGQGTGASLQSDERDCLISARKGGTGSNPQQEAADELDGDNAAWVSEVINSNLTAKVVAWYFGRTAPVLCKLKMRTRTPKNVSQDLEIVKTFHSAGVRLSKSWVAGKLGIVLAGKMRRHWASLRIHSAPEIYIRFDFPRPQQSGIRASANGCHVFLPNSF